MKLFKKLAAAALAAVLALAMVGCGSSASLKDELLKMAMDQMTVAGGTANHSKELDALAAKLVQEADKAAALEANKDEDVKGILTNNEVVKAAGIDTNANGYILNAAPNVQFKSSGALMEYTQLQWMVKAINPYTTNAPAGPPPARWRLRPSERAFVGGTASPRRRNRRRTAPSRTRGDR